MVSVGGSSSPEPFSVEVAEQAGALLVRPRGELDLAGAPEVEALLGPPLRDGRHVVLDLRGLEFLDSSGIRAIVQAHNEAQENGPPARFSIVRPERTTEVWRILEVSGVGETLDVLDVPPGG